MREPRLSPRLFGRQPEVFEFRPTLTSAPAQGTRSLPISLKPYSDNTFAAAERLAYLKRAPPQGSGCKHAKDQDLIR